MYSEIRTTVQEMKRMAEQDDSVKDPKEILNHHRIAGLSITPVMDILGYETFVEIDLALQKQVLGIACVRRKEIVEKPAFPPILCGGLIDAYTKPLVANLATNLDKGFRVCSLRGTWALISK